ncbi:general secretion pathway protein GspB [Vibrio hangzhouensis]|uniref:general secretion pathway protein GspB n=1 Tax=Vibrio hangzhouensis TaxID=462991 RepID=UPI001C986D1A|nr:general secretion pathway protein GspB [Vibrio hangzhouensis]MBY6197057.1 general secretion pathway protein GspB [Vibrio hangzhouensis]
MKAILLMGAVLSVGATGTWAQVLEENLSGGDNAYAVLSYPDFSELKPLPRSQPVLAMTPARSQPAADSGSERSASSTVEPVDNNTFNLADLDLSGLDPKLAKQVESAIRKTEREMPSSRADHIALEGNEARYRGRLPALNLQTHMYSSDVQRRWVKINGKELKEGDRLNSIQLLAIDPQSITIRFDNDIIDIPALYEWAG